MRQHKSQSQACGRAHVAIVSKHIAAEIVAGTKSIESRLTRTRRPPFDRIRSGDRIFFKISGAGVIGSCICRRILQFEQLAPAGVRRLQRLYGRQIVAEPAFWRARQNARYATLVWLGPIEVRSVKHPCIKRQYGNGWVVL